MADAVPSASPAVRIRDGVGLVVVLFAVFPAVAALVLSLIAGVDPSDIVRLLVTAVVYAPVAAVALRLRRADVAAVAAALAVTSGWFALFAVLHRQQPDVAGLEVLLAATAHVARLPELAALGVLPWLIARERGRSQVGGIAFGSGALVLSAAVSLAAPFVLVPTWLVFAPLIWAITSFVIGAALLGRRWRVAGDRARTALAWYAAGVVLLVVSYVRVLVPLTAPFTMLADAIFVLAQGLLPVGILAAIVVSGHDAVERRTAQILAAAQALAFAVAAYLAIAAVTRWLGASPAIVGVASAAGLALVLGGTIRAVRERLLRLLSDPAPDARAVLASLGRHLPEGTGTNGVEEIAHALRETWRLSSVAITTAAGSIRSGMPAADAVTTELISGGRSIGTLTLTDGAAHSLQTEVRPVLEQTAGLISVAVLLATVNEEVSATRRRTLDVRREERRLLHDELHDRLAPALAGVAFGLAAADAFVASGDPRATGALADLRDEVSECTEDVRQLARTLLPTALDQGDLEAALAELAGHISNDLLRVDIIAHASDVLDPGTQLRVYLMLADVLVLARRMDGVRRVEASVSVEPARVRARVRVHEPFPPGAALAIGEALRRRADELGGESSSPGTCTFEAVITR